METPIRKTRAGVLVLLGIAAFAWACSEDADTPMDVAVGNVSGTIEDDSGAPMAGVAVALSRTGETTRHATTAADGSFAFNGVEVGTWTLTVTPPIGFAVAAGQTHPVSVSVTADQTTQVTTLELVEIPVGAISVTVMEGGAPRVGVTIAILNAGTQTQVASKATAAGGVASFPGLPLGNYSVRMTVPAGSQLPAGETNVKPATVTEGNVTTVAFELEPVPGADVTINLNAASFSPDSITIPAGSTVRWINSTTLNHTVTPQNSSQAGVWADHQFAGNNQGATFDHTFTVAGQKYRYRCEPHSFGFDPGDGMTGVIVVQ